MSLHGYSGAYGDYVKAMRDFLVILEADVNGNREILGYDGDALQDAADNLFEAAYDANLGVWASDA